MFFERSMSFLFGLLGNILLLLFVCMICFGSYGPQYFHVNQVFYILLMGGILILLMVYLHKHWLPMVKKLILRDVQVTIGIFLLILLAHVLHTYLLPVFTEDAENAQTIAYLTKNGLTISFVMEAVLFGPVREEVFTRGLLQNGAFKNTHKAVWGTAVFFAFLHGFSSFPAFLMYFIPGLGFGYLYKLTENLSLSMLCHILFNSLPFLAFLFVK